jgi:uncharacterized membrane protein
MFTLFIFIFFVWILIAFAPLLEKKAKNLSGGVSLFPGIPVMPLLAWGLAWALNSYKAGLGFRLVGWLHVVLLIALLISALKWLLQIRRNNRRREESNAEA